MPTVWVEWADNREGLPKDPADAIAANFLTLQNQHKSMQSCRFEQLERLINLLPCVLARESLSGWAFAVMGACVWSRPRVHWYFVRNRRVCFCFCYEAVECVFVSVRQQIRSTAQRLFHFALVMASGGGRDAGGGGNKKKVRDSLFGVAFKSLFLARYR
jgi:hypothetical protein